MTRLLEPTLVVRKFLVVGGGKTAFEAEFNDGVNIFSGSNGSGKSTIADLLFFALGGENPRLKEEALACDHTFAEVEINGDVLTLRRAISSSQRRPLAISWAPLDEARKDAVEGWEVYPFARTDTKDSFSQVLLRALNVPEALKGDLSSLITMHQLLRLMYVDQESPFSSIFRIDQFDSRVTRSGVGDLLLGLYEPVLYSLRLELAEKRKRLSEVNLQYSGARRVLSEGGAELTLEMLRQARDEAVEERGRLEAAIAEFERPEAEDEEDLRSEWKARRIRLRDELIERNRDVREALDRLETLDFEIQDSASFLEALERRRSALDEATSLHEALGSVSFAFCPACLSPLREAVDSKCRVCGEDAKGDRIERNVARLRHQLDMQINESKTLQEERIAEREQLVRELPVLQERREAAQRKYDASSGGARSVHQEEISRLNRKIGYLDRKIQDLERRIRLAESIQALAREREELTAQVATLETKIADKASAIQAKRGQVEQLVGRLTAELLRGDLPRELKFETAERVTFDFGEDEIAVGGKTAFAASSNVYLKNAFHLALLLASLEEPAIRYPRFWLCDNIEDKGMEPVRSHNFQRIIVERSNSSDVVHQVIFTTSMIAPDLDSSEYVIDHFSRDHKSLDI